MKAAVFLLLAVGLAYAQTNVTVSGTSTYQTMNGVGSNVNSWSWKNGELKPALDLLVDTLGHNLFRVIHDRMEWAGRGSTRPANTLTNLQNLDPATLQAVYETPDMQDLWNTIAYLNSKGVTADQIIVNFMGWTAVWMGGSGAYGSPSHITNTTQTNQDIAAILASLIYYGHHRREISGANSNLSFSYIAPFNEPDLNGMEGPLIGASQLNMIFGNLVTSLNAMGDSSTRVLGPDTIGAASPYSSAFSMAVRARMSHASFHSYGDSSTYPETTYGGVPANWLTETSVWCSGCDSNQPIVGGEWPFGSGIGDNLLGDIENGFSAVLTWEGFDTFYYHHNSYSAWGHIGCTQNGRGCSTSDTYPRVYAVRQRAYPEAILAKGIRPGMVRLRVTTTLSRITALAFYDSAGRRFSLLGHNSSTSDQTLSVAVNGISGLSVLTYYRANSTENLQKQSDVEATNGSFSATVPADTFFVISNLDVVPSCSYAIDPTSRTHGAGSETGTITVTAPTGCAWTATTNSTWAAIQDEANGTGNGRVAYNVSGNPSSISRTTTLTVAGQTFALTQAGVSCSYAIDPTSRTHGAGSETGTITVTAPEGCAWTANTNGTWAAIEDGANGTGNGTVTYEVAANPSNNQRSYEFTVAGQDFTVTQMGAERSYPPNQRHRPRTRLRQE